MCNHSVVKLHKGTQMFVIVDYVRESTSNKFCKYSEYVSFEDFLFWFLNALNSDL